MAEEPNKKMDEMLKAYAEERRKAPELYLHPATRRMLQGEVERTFNQKPRRSGWDRIRSFWPQIAFGGALCCFLGVAILTLRQPSRQETERSAQEKKQAEALDLELMKEQPASPPEGQLNLRPEPAVGETVVEVPRYFERKVLNEKQLERERLDRLSVGQPSPAVAPPSPAPNASSPLARDNTVNFYDTSSAALKRKDGVAGADAAPQPTRGRAAQSVSTVSQEAKTDVKEEIGPTLTATDSRREQALAKEPARPAEVQSRSFRGGAEVKQQDSSFLKSAIPERGPEEATGAVTTGTSLAFGIQGPANQPTQPPAVPAQTSAFEMTNLGAARRLYFVQATNTAAVGLVPMFTSFQFEQAGNDVRVLDRDGSVYLGVIQPGDGLARTDAFGSVALQRVAELPQPTNTAQFELTVRGTNRTGNNVVLTGKMFERTNNSRITVESLSLAPGTQGRASARRPAAASEPRHLFIGNAIIGSTNQVPVRAVSREP